MPTLSNHRWIAGPKQDIALLIGLPVLIVPVVAFLLSTGISDPRNLNAWVFALGAQGHHLPGWLRAYGDRSVFDAYRQRLILGPIVILSIAIVCTVADLQVLVLAAYLWGIWHALMQTYGVARVYGRFGGTPDRLVRWDLITCQVGFIGAVLASPMRQHYILDFMLRLGLPIPDQVTLDNLRVVSICVTIAVMARWLYLQWVNRSPSTHPGRWLLIPSSIAFWWFCNLTINHMLIGLALFEIFHDLQYLSLVWWVGRTRQRQGAGGQPAQWLYGMGGLSIGFYVGACLLYGAISSPGEVGSSLYRVGVGVLAASQLLHFYFDGFIWRLNEAANATWVQKQSSPTTKTHRTKPWGVMAALAVLGLGATLESRHESSADKRIPILAQAVPDSPIAQTQLGALYRAKNDTPAAIIAYRKALELTPDYDRAMAGEEQAYKEAVERGSLDNLSIEDCVQIRHAGFSKSAFEVGKKASLSGLLKRASSSWRTAICLDPTNIEAIHSLAVFHAKQAEFAQAKAILSTGLSHQPDSEELKELLAAITGRRE